MNYIIAILIGALIGFCIPMVQKSALKSVSMQHAAADYVKKNSLKFSRKTDTYLYKRVEKTAIPKEQQR